MVWRTLLCCVLVVSGCVSGGEVDSKAVEAAAKKAAEYLISVQNENGTFGKSRAAAMPGLVGLVVKALATSPAKYREDNPAVAKAVKYLLANVQPNGSIAIPQFSLENYNTSVALLGLASMESPAHGETIKKAKEYILKCQCGQDTGKSAGGFGYGAADKGGDLSNTSLSLEALKAAGLSENDPAWQNATKFIRRCQDNDETNDFEEMHGGDNGGGFVYIPGMSPFGTVKTRGGKELPKPYGTMTYGAIKSLIYAKVDAKDPALNAAYKWVKANYNTKENPGGAGTQGYYYYVISFAKAFSASGEKEFQLADGQKANWAKDLAMQLLNIQKENGAFSNEDPKWMEDDPVLATSYALEALNLCLQAMK